MTERPSDDEMQPFLDDIATTGVFPSEEGALHYWMAMTQACARLDCKHLIEELREAEPLVDPVWVDANAPDLTDPEAVQEWVDALGDAGRLLGVRLGVELERIGIPQAQILIYFPCHGGVGTVFFDGSGMAPRVVEWA